MSNPSDLLYDKTHEWVRVEGDVAVIGITHFAQDALGDITYVDLPEVGTALTAGAEFGSIESVKAASELYSPVNGEVVAANDDINNAPEVVNNSPYTDGWMIKVKLSGKPEGLLDVAAYEAFCAEQG